MPRKVTDAQTSAVMSALVRKRYADTTEEQRREMTRAAREARTGKSGTTNPDVMVKCFICGTKNRRGDSRVVREVFIKARNVTQRTYVGPCCKPAPS